jgi:hypothetical protein
MTSMVRYMLDEDRLTEGVQLPLFDRDGELTDDWIRVRSMHCDEFQQAMEDGQADMRKNGSESVKEWTLKAQICLVAAWSFEEDCTPENVEKFLILAPHIAKRVDKAAGNNSLFFPESGKGSLNGQKSKSPIKRKSRAANEQSATT